MNIQSFERNGKGGGGGRRYFRIFIFFIAHQLLNITDSILLTNNFRKTYIAEKYFSIQRRP
ncbi:hypothetical protein B7991_05600 [Fibrobacter sp. UWB3]|nr:hypothetical protein B7991_05600 [Fibrobacter sp. UWB3]